MHGEMHTYMRGVVTLYVLREIEVRWARLRSHGREACTPFGEIDNGRRGGGGVAGAASASSAGRDGRTVRQGVSTHNLDVNVQPT